MYRLQTTLYTDMLLNLIGNTNSMILKLYCVAGTSVNIRQSGCCARNLR